MEGPSAARVDHPGLEHYPLARGPPRRIQMLGPPGAGSRLVLPTREGIEAVTEVVRKADVAHGFCG